MNTERGSEENNLRMASYRAAISVPYDDYENGGVRVEELKKLSIRDVDTEVVAGIRHAMHDLDTQGWKAVEEAIASKISHDHIQSKFSPAQRVAMLQLFAAYPVNRLTRMFNIRRQGFISVVDDGVAALAFALGEQNEILSAESLNRVQLNKYRDYKKIENEHNQLKDILSSKELSSTFDSVPAFRTMTENLYQNYSISELLQDLNISAPVNVNYRFRRFVLDGWRSDGAIHLIRRVSYQGWLRRDTGTNINNIDMESLYHQFTTIAHEPIKSQQPLKKVLHGRTKRIYEYLRSNEKIDERDAFINFVQHVAENKGLEVTRDICRVLHVQWVTARKIYATGRYFADFMLHCKSDTFTKDDLLGSLSGERTLYQIFSNYRDIINKSEAVQPQEGSKRGRASQPALAEARL